MISSKSLNNGNDGISLYSYFIYIFTKLLHDYKCDVYNPFNLLFVRCDSVHYSIKHIEHIDISTALKRQTGNIQFAPENHCILYAYCVYLKKRNNGLYVMIMPNSDKHVWLT